MQSDPCFPRWTGQLAVFGGNALVGGVVGGVGQKLSGGSFRDGFARGVLGGGVVYVGKRIAAERANGAGVLGRQVAAVGSSLVRNAAADQPSFRALLFPIGPVNLHLERAERAPVWRPRVRPRLDLATVLWTGYAIATPELQWDAPSSWSAGAPVFRAFDRVIKQGGDTLNAQGLTVAGVVLLSEFRERGRYERRNREYTIPTFAHERIHVLQHDFNAQTIGIPAGHWLLRRVPGGKRVGRYLDLNLDPVFPLFGVLIHNGRSRPWELEAEYLGERQ